MKTNKNTNRQPAPKHETGVTGDDTRGGTEIQLGKPLEPAANVHQIGQRPNAFAIRQSETGSVVADKLQLLGSIRQRLAEAVDLDNQGGAKAKEAENIADSQSIRLYQARLQTGGLDANEVSGMLGDVFGYKPKQDGTPGKTPAGLGESIRKRVVRLVGAAEFVTGGEGGAFFNGLDPTAEVLVAENSPPISIVGILDRVEARAKDPEGKAGMSLYTAFDKLADIRKASLAPRPAPWLDPKHVASLVGKLREPGAIAVLMDTPGLETAYSALWAVLTVNGESIVIEREKRKEAAAKAEKAEAQASEAA